MPNLNFTFNTAPLSSAPDEMIKPSVFGYEFLGHRIFDGIYPNFQNELGLQHLRWPGGDYVELKRDLDGNPGTQKDYAYALTNPDYVHPGWTRGNGDPREGITEMFEFAVDNNLSLSMVAPTARYVRMRAEGKDGAAQAAADMELFLNRVFSGEFGEVPRDFTIELGSEYFNTDVWRDYSGNYTNDPENIDGNGTSLAYMFGEVFASMAARIDEVQASHPGNQGWNSHDINVSVQMGRFHAPSDDHIHGGEYEDNADFIAAFEDHGQSALNAVDSVLWHRYATGWDQLGTGIWTPTNNNDSGDELTVSDLVEHWNGAIGNGADIDLLAGFLSPTVNGAINKLEHNETGLTNMLQLTTGLLDEGMDYASIYGFSTDKFGSMAHKGEIFTGAKLWSLMSESLPGMQVMDGYQNNTAPVITNSAGQDILVNDDSVNSYVFNSEYKSVIFLAAKDFGTAGAHAGESLFYNIALDDTYFAADATHLWAGDVSKVQQMDSNTGQMQPIGKIGETFAEDVPVTHNGSSSSLGVTFNHDYEVIRLTLYKHVYGTDSYDILKGSGDPNIIEGLEGHDLIHGHGGEDTLNGNAGDDEVLGGDGPDTVKGGWGDDTVSGGAGNDKVSGDWGDDYLYGNSGNDRLFGGDGDDTVGGGSGGDMMDAGAGYDLLSYASAKSAVTLDLAQRQNNLGDARGDRPSHFEHYDGSRHDDMFLGDGEQNIFKTGAGDDTLEGRGGNDILVGGDGDDLFLGGAGADGHQGSAGVDTIDYSASAEAVTVNITGDYGTGKGGDAAGDVLVNIEQVIGSQHDDLLSGEGVFHGGDGDDIFHHSSQAAVFNGGSGADSYILETGFKQKTIQDFGQDGEDRIDLSQVAWVGNFADLLNGRALQTEQGVEIQHQEDLLLLENTQMDELNENWFLF